MKCSVCNHPERSAIDRDLLAGGFSFEALKKKFGPSMSALWRHKKHLLEKVAQAEKRFLDNLRLGVLLKLNSRLERNERTAQAAEADGNSRLVLQADRDATGSLLTSTKWMFNWTRTRSTASWPRPSGPSKAASCPPIPNSSPLPTNSWPTNSSSPARSLIPIWMTLMTRRKKRNIPQLGKGVIPARK